MRLSRSCFASGLFSSHDVSSGVSIGPGAIAFVRIRFGPNCTAEDLVSAITAPLLAVYASWGTVQPTSATNDATLMTEPPPERRSSGMACLQHR